MWGGTPRDRARGRAMTFSTDANDGSAPARRGVPRQKAIRALADFGLPTAVFIGIIAAWYLAIEYFEIPAYLLPPPQDVLPRIGASWQSLWNHSLITIEEILLGFGLSIVTAIPMGLLIALSPMAKRMLYPLLVFIQLVPKIAIAPLFVVWIGFGMASKVM